MKISIFDDRPFGATVTNFNCADVDPDQANQLRQALHQYEVLVFPNQHHLTPDEEVTFYRSLDTEGETVWRDQINNPWEVYKVEQGNQAGTYQIPDTPGVLVLGKGKINHYGLKVTLGGDRGAYGKDKGSQVLGGGGLQWHIDGTFQEYEPCLYTQMRCIEAPTGEGHWIHYQDGTNAKLWCEAGATAFASGRHAYALLSEKQKQIAKQSTVHYLNNPFQSTFQLGNTPNGLRIIDEAAEQQYANGQDQSAASSDKEINKIHPLLWNCPITNKPALMIHPRCMHHLEQAIEPLGIVESRHNVESFMRPAIEPESVYVHPWQAGDLVIWNNRSIWHSATGSLADDDRRVQHLTAFNSVTPP